MVDDALTKSLPPLASIDRSQLTSVGARPSRRPRQSTTQFAGSSILRQSSHTALDHHRPNVRTWCLPPIKPLRSVPFLANQVVSLPSLSTCPILTHPFPSHARHYASIGPRPGLRAKDPLRGQLASVRHRRQTPPQRTSREKMCGKRSWEKCGKLANQRCHHGSANGFGTYGLTPSPSNPALRMADLSHPQRDC